MDIKPRFQVVSVELVMVDLQKVDIEPMKLVEAYNIKLLARFDQTEQGDGESGFWVQHSGGSIELKHVTPAVAGQLNIGSIVYLDLSSADESEGTDV